MPRKNNDHVSLYSEETNAENSAGLVMRIYRSLLHLHEADGCSCFQNENTCSVLYVEYNYFQNGNSCYKRAATPIGMTALALIKRTSEW